MELSVLRNAHVRELENRNKSSETVRFYRQSYRELENFFGEGSPKLADLNLVTKGDLYAVMEGMRARGCVPGTVHAVMRGVRAIFNWAHEGEYLDVNPMSKVKLPSVPKKLMPCVQPEMAARVVKLTERDGAYRSRNRLIVSLMYDTGLRLAEVASLDVGDLDMKHGSLTVRAGKGDRDRVVPFGNEVLRCATRYMRDRRPIRLDEPRLLLARGGAPLTKWGIGQVLEGYALELGLTRSELAPHAWRRGFAVQYLRNGGELFALQQLLGHQNLEMTRKYVNYLASDLKRTHSLISPMDRLGK